jgi:hypothetical protein
LQFKLISLTQSFKGKFASVDFSHESWFYNSLEVLGDANDQSAHTVLPGLSGLSVEGDAELFSQDFFSDGTELLHLKFKVKTLNCKNLFKI